MFAETRRREIVETNMGDRDADTVIVGGKHVNVETGEILDDDIAIVGERIAAVGDVDRLIGDDTAVIDAEGKYLVPGFIDAHLHSYHSYINSTEFAKLLLKEGCTSYADGFYGQAIVGGLDAIEFLRDEFAATPLHLIMLVPAIAHHQVTNYGVPPTGTGLSTEDMMEMIEWPDCRGVEEPTHEPITAPDDWHFQPDAYYDLCERAIELNKVVTGHAVDVSPAELTSFVAAGASTDHEAVTTQGAIDRTRLGMTLLSRYGSGSPFHHTPFIVKAMTEHGLDDRAFSFCSDLQALDDFDTGTINRNVQVAIENGIAPITAVQMGTINAAEALRVDNELGSIVPGKVADVVLVEDLTDFISIDTVMAGGDVVVEGGDLVASFERPDYPEWATNTVNLDSIDPEAFAVNASPDADSVTVRTVDIFDETLLTEEGRAELDVVDGEVQMDVENDVLKAVMLDRHEESGRVGQAFVRGFGIDEGAIGFSVNVIRQNLMVLGTNDADMQYVAERILDTQGGIVTARDGESLAEVPIPLFGLQSIKDHETAVDEFRALTRSIHELGSDLTVPLASLEFVCIVPQMGTVRLSEYGLSDLRTCERVDLILEEH